MSIEILGEPMVDQPRFESDMHEKTKEIEKFGRSNGYKSLSIQKTVQI
jgi:hypothetical protein